MYRSIRRSLGLTLGLGIILLPAMGCTDRPDTLRIGATMSESGAYATQGTAARNGYLLCQEHLNEAGGILNRPVEFTILDDRSDPELAPELYEKLISKHEVDAVMGPYGSTLTEAVAPVTEAHEMIHISPLAATTSIWEQGREYLFMVLPPAELFLAGVMHLAAERDLNRIAVVKEDQLFPRAAGAGAQQTAEDLGLEVVFHTAYESGTEDFSSILRQIRDGDVEVLAMAASNLDDFIRMTEQLRDSSIDLKMFGSSGAVEEYIETLGEDGEYTYGLSAWEPTLDRPGIETFVADYQERFDRAPSFHAAGAYGSCRLFAKAAKEAGSIESGALRTALLDMRTTTLFGPFEVDSRGYQIANQGILIQWQDGEKAVVWPEEQATAEPRFPTPPWDERGSD
ncbi:amino acid ABC transporter substrate-binding protein [Gammaproteobacteria bacterium AB-CW1]|uniref:Amino acid ABC transporter substrate-binding protein n=1 Tax=Natronospira elongata TaxID=3110268 RepID=A0AAP6JE55_9GAMM|nr:amino acid ABC transporter substrate-binding protein [Gammaproteobacteria bacterium AB-CW1]